MIDGDTSSPIFQVRLTIGDVSSPYYISDDIIQYLLDENDGDVQQASIQAVRYLVSYFSRLFEQEVGDVRFKWSELRNNYKELLNDLTTNPNMGGTLALHIFGGTDCDEIARVKRANVKQAKVSIGEFSDIPSSGIYTVTNPYLQE